MKDLRTKTSSRPRIAAFWFQLSLCGASADVSRCGQYK